MADHLSEQELSVLWENLTEDSDEWLEVSTALMTKRLRLYEESDAEMEAAECFRLMSQFSCSWHYHLGIQHCCLGLTTHWCLRSKKPHDENVILQLNQYEIKCTLGISESESVSDKVYSGISGQISVTAQYGALTSTILYSSKFFPLDGPRTVVSQQ
jgi:hypothetical protein